MASSSPLKPPAAAVFPPPTVSCAPTKRVLIAVATGSEEIETVTLLSVLRRASAEVTLASVDEGSSLHVECSRHVLLQANVLLRECCDQEFDAILLPGGTAGAERFRDSPMLISMLQKQAREGKLYGAICASPAIALSYHGLIGDKAVCHPSLSQYLVSSSGTQLAPTADTITSGPRVVFDPSRNLITSMSPGSSLEFALGVVSVLYGVDVARQVAKPMCPNFEVPAKL